jgi:SAM-dependent methyltransferase
VALLETERAVRAALPPAPARVLEVGAGDGALAARLAAAGWTVVPLDWSEDAVAAARERGLPAVHGDFHAYEAPPFEALLFTRSLHHVHPLGAAIERARSLLVTGGLLFAEELAFEEADDSTVNWLAAHEARLQHRGELARDPIVHAESELPLTRWTRHHVEDHEVHRGSDLIAAIARAFEIVRVERPPYLFRYLAANLVENEAGTRAAMAAREAERAAIESGSIRAIGLRIIARRRDATLC